MSHRAALKRSFVPTLWVASHWWFGLVCVAADAHSERFSERLQLGAPLSSGGCRDIAGRQHELSPSSGVAATVLAFNGIGCPLSELYTPRVEELATRFASRGVRFFAVNSNHHDTVDELRQFAQRHDLKIPLLKDFDHALADRLGATRTTEVFLFDADFKLRYRGRVDDQYSLTDLSVGVRKARPERGFLADAIETVLAGGDVKTSTTEAVGCVIDRKRDVKQGGGVTFHRDVEPILQARCQSCHRDGEIAPFPLLDYDDVAGWSGMIREVVLNRRMPPWHADAGVGDFINDRSLTDGEVDTLVRWVDHGAPRGDVRDRPPAVEFPDGWQIGEPDAIYGMPEAFEVPAEGTVRYQYFKIETNLDEDRWVTAAEVRPGNRAVVHHILVFAIDPKRPRAWRRDRGGAAGYFAAMVPGERPVIYPPGAGKRLPAGATLVMQVHYTANGQPQTDRSRVAFRFAQAPVTREVRTRSAYQDHLLIVPPNTADHPVSARFTFKRDAHLLSFLPHMHLRGKAFEYVAHYPTRARVSVAPNLGKLSAADFIRLNYDEATGELTWVGEMDDATFAKLQAMYAGNNDDLEAIDTLRRQARSETLLSVSRYDFGWQSTYRLREPKWMPRGAQISCTGWFDNSSTNLALTSDMWSQTVRWGEQTWEEMLIGYFDYIPAKPSAAPRRKGD